MLSTAEKVAVYPQDDPDGRLAMVGLRVGLDAGGVAVTGDVFLDKTEARELADAIRAILDEDEEQS